jgi:hypothetical protein
MGGWGQLGRGGGYIGHDDNDLSNDGNTHTCNNHIIYITSYYMPNYFLLTS